jgi:hypothetical protein
MYGSEKHNYPHFMYKGSKKKSVKTEKEHIKLKKEGWSMRRGK